MAVTYKLIETVTVGVGGASSIEFTSIPQTYTDLVVKLSLRTSANNVTAKLEFNGSSLNLTQRFIQGSGSAASSGTSSAINLLENPSSATANVFSNNEIYVPNYTGSTYKSVSIDTVTEKNATDAYQRIVAGLWSNVAAITSLTVTCTASGNFVQYSSASLYGIKNS
jgi:hypothetical protein